MTEAQCYRIDLQLVRHGNRVNEVVALVETPDGEEIGLITDKREGVTKSLLAHSVFCKSLRLIAERGGKDITVSTNFVPFFRDLRFHRKRFPVSEKTFTTIRELGIRIHDVRLEINDDTGIVL